MGPDVATSKLISSKQFSLVKILTCKARVLKSQLSPSQKLTILIRKLKCAICQQKTSNANNPTLPSTQHKFNISSTFIFTAIHPRYLPKYQTSSIAKIL